MCDFAGVLLPTPWGEGHVLGQDEAPALFEGQVGQLGIGELHAVLHQLDGDVRGVETTHMADEGVFLVKLSWVVTVHLDLGWG